MNPLSEKAVKLSNKQLILQFKQLYFQLRDFCLNPGLSSRPKYEKEAKEIEEIYNQTLEKLSTVLKI